MADDENDTLLGKGGINRIRRIFPDDSQVTVERDFWDSVAMEPARLAGTKVRFWSLRRSKNMHPLYREPSKGGDHAFHGPWEMWASLEFDQANDINPQMQTEGFVKESDARMWIARREFEDVDAPRPKEGDVIDFWDESPWGPENRWWDVVKANPDGNIFSSEVFVQYKLELRRRSKFEAGRKALGENV